MADKIPVALTAGPDRKRPVPADVGIFWLFDSDAALKAHPAYVQAKAGDANAALTLVMDLALPTIIEQWQRFGEDSIFVVPFAREASGDNAIPQVLANVCAVICGATADEHIVQVTRVYHTGADPMERLALRPVFEGEVQAGRSYVLVDDVVSMGGTLAELADYIQSKGGIVQDILVLVNAGRNKSIHPTKRQLKTLKERYHRDIKDIFGIEIDALTANEAGYLIGFRTANEIRNRLAKAKEEVNRRLGSKGIAGVFG